MFSFSAIQNWLSEKDIENLSNGKWELDCPRMSLRRKSKKSKEIYNGSGYIIFNTDHTLKFKIYSKQQVGFEDIFADFDIYIFLGN